MDTIASSFLTVLSSNMQVISTAIKSRMSLNSGHIRPLTSELPALESRKNCGYHCAFNFDRISFKLADNKDRHEIWEEFHFGPEWTIRFR